MKSTGSTEMVVSMFVFGYNQECYIRDAILGAFSQSYSPLEIILSDDCSSDRTFTIMEEMAACYEGPHKIVLNRNPKNLGHGGNINRCIELSHGDWIVKADGDDISLPHRIEKIVAAVSDSPSEIHLVYSGNEMISNDGSSVRKNLTAQLEPVDLQKQFIEKDSYILGATSSWSRACAERFECLFDGHHDDHIFPMRALLLGRIVFIPEALVKYRVFAGSTFSALHPVISWSRFYEKIKSSHDASKLSLETEGKLIGQKMKDLKKIDFRQAYLEILETRHFEVGLFTKCLCEPSHSLALESFMKCRRNRFYAFRLFVKGRVALLLREASSRPKLGK